jgi:hypothetical protein
VILTGEVPHRYVAQSRVHKHPANGGPAERADACEGVYHADPAPNILDATQLPKRRTNQHDPSSGAEPAYVWSAITDPVSFFSDGEEI